MNGVQVASVTQNQLFALDVVVLPSVSIGEGAIVQAGSVITSDALALAIVGGHPARQFSTRDANHYQTLKSLRKLY
jgi:acetyltransferase-like isoleucine patch superfamily enzyme